MDNKLLLVFILLFLSFLLLFYYLKLKTNLIMLLSIIIVLCINKLIVQKEYFFESKGVSGEAVVGLNEDPNKYIERGLIDYILRSGEAGSDNLVAQLPFYGSEKTTSSTPTLKTKKGAWREILKLIRDDYTKDPQDEPSSSLAQIPFNGSETPTTSTA